MTCHSRAKQMFIDAQYQPHSSSVRVRTLAAMSPTTPTHLALPPHNTGGETTFRLLMADVELSPCAFTQSEERAAVCLFIYYLFFLILTVLLWSHCNTTATSPEPLPLLFPHLWCGSSHFLVVTPSAFTLTRDTHDKLGVEVKVMGCESNAPAPTTHTAHIYTKAARHKNISRVCLCVCVRVRNLAHNTVRHSALLWDKEHKLCCKQGGDLDVYHTRKENRKWKSWLPSTPTLTPTSVSLQPHLFHLQRYWTNCNTALWSMHQCDHTIFLL